MPENIVNNPPSPNLGDERLVDRTRTFRRCLVFIILNGLVVLGFALLHNFSQAADLHSNLSYRSYCCWIGLETTALFFPSVLLLILFYWHLPRLATIASLLLTVVTSAVYFVDLAVLMTIREHLFSQVFYRLASSVTPFLHSYLSTGMLVQAATLIVGWVFGQYCFWKLAGVISKTNRQPRQRPQLETWKVIPLFGVATAPVVVALLPAFTNWQRTLSEIVLNSERHPITACGFFAANNVPALRSGTIDAIRGQAWMMNQSPLAPEFVARYKQLTARRLRSAANASTDQERLPDVMLIISECLRPDVISQKTTPNIYAKRQTGLDLQQHYSVGNTSNFGFFGVMYGLDGCWLEQAGDMPVGLFDGLKQVGYKTGFFGRDDFNNFGMEKFCSPDRFDESVFVHPSDPIQCDQTTCKLAADFFDRKGKYAADPDPPRMAIVYLYAPHNSFHTEQDKIHDIHDSDAVPGAERRHGAGFVDFLNSIHFVDRTIAPLLKDDRITFVMGDHGESFGEDRRGMHGSALSSVQLQVCCVGFGPGIESRKVTAPTSHYDLLPTLADALGIEFSDPDIFPGQSLLGSLPQKRLIGCRGFGSQQYLVIKPGRTLGDREFGYQGFFDMNWNMLAPGAPVDTFGESLIEDPLMTGLWSDAELMLDWMKDRFGEDFIKIPLDPAPLLHQSIEHPDAQIRRHTIRLIRGLGPRANEFQQQLEECLSDRNENVRQDAFKLLHAIHRD